MRTSAASLLPLCLMMGFQVVSGYTATGTCLQGFVSDIPAENTLLRYTRLNNNEDSMKTLLFPSTAFLCNGTLQELAIPYVVDRGDNLVWHANLTAAISVWRPTATGHTEVVRFQLAVHLPVANEDLLYVAINTHSDTIVAQPPHLVTVHRGDIIGVTLSPKVKAEYIPLLLMKSTGSESSEQEGCGDINATHNCNIISDRTPLIAVNVTILQGDVPPNATCTLEGITPSATCSCACSHEVTESTQQATVYISVCSNLDASLSDQLRQPPILATAPRSDSMPTGITAVNTMLHQGTSAASANILSMQPQQTTHSFYQLQPTSVPPVGHTTEGPRATGSTEKDVAQGDERADSVCEGTPIALSAVLGATAVALLIVTITLSVFVALLAMKVKQLRVSRNMQGFVKSCNAYIDIEQKEKHLDSKDTEAC